MLIMVPVTHAKGKANTGSLQGLRAKKETRIIIGISET